MMPRIDDRALERGVEGFRAGQQLDSSTVEGASSFTCESALIVCPFLSQLPLDYAESIASAWPGYEIL